MLGIDMKTDATMAKPQDKNFSKLRFVPASALSQYGPMPTLCAWCNVSMRNALKGILNAGSLSSSVFRLSPSGVSMEC